MKIENSHPEQCRRIKLKIVKNQGFSILEVILAVAVFTMFSSSVVILMISGFNSNRQGAEETVAAQYAAEGLEAARSIKNQGFTNLANSAGTGISRVSNLWAFSGSNNTIAHGSNGNYTRVLSVTDVWRDSSGNIAPTPTGVVYDPTTKKVTSTVTWNFSPTRVKSTQLSTYFTNWKLTRKRGGMLVYGNGGTSTDAIQYKILDSTTSTWGTALAFPDIDTSSTNRELRSVRLYSASVRDEKIALTRHYNGSQQYMYATVFNGISWSTPILLASWTSSSNLDARNYDGAYLSDGRFLTVYSDNTSIPKYRIWNGQSWSSQGSLVNLANNGSAIPLFIVMKTRPNTNEAMVAFYGTASDTNTEYFKNESWNLHARHALAGPASREMVDFAWSPQNPTQGALVFPDAASGAESRDISFRVFTTDSSAAGGTWSSIVESDSTGNTIGALDIDGRMGAEEFAFCSKNSADDIYCFRGNTNPLLTTPTNNILTTGTDAGNQRSFATKFESLTGTNALSVYSDTTAIPKLKKYTASTNMWDSAATNLSSVTSALETVRMDTLSESDDIMILMANTNQQFFSVVWNGSTNAIYTTPSGKAFSAHGINGSTDTDYWYDFVWDQY